MDRRNFVSWIFVSWIAGFLSHRSEDLLPVSLIIQGLTKDLVSIAQHLGKRQPLKKKKKNSG